MLWIDFFILLALIAVNAFFALSELAVVSSRRGRLAQMALDGKRGAKAAIALVDDPTGFLSSVQIGITLVAILSGAYGEAAFAGPMEELLKPIPVIGPYAGPIGSGIVVTVLAYVSLIGGELVPKRLALTNPERFACFVAGPMTVLATVGKPIVWLLRKTTEALLALLGANSEGESRVTEEEVKSLIAEGTEAGVFHPAEREMIEGVLRVSDRTVRSIMVARPDVIWLDPDDPPSAILDEVLTSGHSRFPVSTGDIDEVIGIVHAKDLLQQMRLRGDVDLRAAVREPLFIGDRTPILKLMDSFRTANVHLAIVVDEHGTFEGIVTPSDILIAIAGDMPEEAEEDPDAVQREDGSWLLDGRMSVDDVERLLGARNMRTDGDFSTLAGFVLDQVRHIPEPGEWFVWKTWRFEVVDLDGRRIDKVLVTRRDEES